MNEALVAEFDDAAALTRAIETLRAQGYRQLDALLPYPVDAVDTALQLPRSRLGYVSAACGVLAGAGAYAVQWWTNVVNFPIRVGGFAPHAPLAFLPITFESTVLGAVLGAFFALLWRLKLPAWWHPIFEIDGIEAATDDRFYLILMAHDPLFHATHSAAHMASLNSLKLHHVGP